MEGAVEAEDASKAQRIAVFLRLRPVARPSGRIAASPQEGWVQFDVPKDAAQGLINNSRETYRFPFDGLLPPDAGQGEVFDRVALPVLRAALDGYNGTVFAFGQTGSGKTFTITGGTERYADRGLIPRAISALFAEAAARSGHTFAVHISYLEIYNESGFDLLEPGREVRALEDLPRVQVQEDDGGAMHLRNLSMHRCDTEEQALNMLFLGDTNRVVAETPLNQASSRSHCVFTLHIEARRAGADALVRRSKLHFVDLAGSERVGKSGLAAHLQLKEAKYINLSLHFLEQVIISLQEGRPHVPYRNSLLTMVLRDSLGGNTRTVMVAAVAPEAQHIEESISTCRFAQRVAMISNKVEVNEELDLEVVIRQLKRENALLRQELHLLRNCGAGGGSSGDGADAADGGGGLEQRTGLTEAEQHVLRRQVQAYVEDPSPDALLGVEPSMLFIRAAFDLLKSMARGAAPQAPASGSPSPVGGAAAAGAATEAELRSLRQLVQRQEQQIKVLSGVLRKQGAEGAAAGGSTSVDTPSRPTSSNSGHSSGGAGGSCAHAGWSQLQAQQAQQQRAQRPPSSAAGARPAVPYSDALLADQHKAFEYFCTTSPAHDAVAEHKAVLRARYEEARTLGSQVSAAKQRISDLKAAVERRRLGRSMAALLRQQQGGGQEDDGERQREAAEEERAKAQIEQEKAAYRSAYDQLKAVKADIDGVQVALERSRARLQADFQAWFAAMAAGAAGGRAGAAASSNSGAADSPGAAEQAQRQEQPASQQHQHSPMLPQQPSMAQQQPVEVAGQEWAIAAARPHSGRSMGGRRPPVSDVAPPPEAAGLPSFASWKTAGSFHFEHQPATSPGSIGGSPTGMPGLAATPAAPAALGAPKPMPAVAASTPVPAPPYTTEAASSAVAAAAAPPAADDPTAGVDPEVLAAAKPLLTGNASADRDIIRFYEARAALLKGMRA